MQRTATLLACFIPIAIGSVNCYSQQYPFVHYTPKDGLISNQIRTIDQDSKGRLYFTSGHGLSVYDGSRFVNYNSRNGLGFDFVNCVMEMGDDSIWIITNSDMVNCLVKGKMKTLSLQDHHYIINNICKDEKGDLYAAAEEGLLVFDNKDRFVKIPLVDTKGEDISRYMAYVFSFGDYLLLLRDNSMIPDPHQSLYLYNKTDKKIISELQGIYTLQIAPDGRIWASTEKKIMSLDTTELKKGKLVLQELPELYAKIRNEERFFVFFDSGNNCWVGDQKSVLIKVAPDGTMTTFTSASGLNMFFLNFIFRDREGTTWIATNNDGVSKLVNSNFSRIENPFDIVSPTDISYNTNTEKLLIYSFSAYTAALVHNNDAKYLHIQNSITLSRLVETPHGFFGIDRNTLYKLELKKNQLYPIAILSDSSGNVYSNFSIDKNGNLIITGKYHLTAVINGKTFCKIKLPYFADLPAIDSKGNIWVATRSNDLIMYVTHPEDPIHYLEQKLYFKKELSGISPRSVAIDKYDNIWIGTRNHGIHVFYLKKGDLIKKLALTTSSGLSDDFITHLTCDAQNIIWASSILGLDKITIKNETPIIENITKQNNIYKSVFTVVNDKDNNIWGLVSNGVIRITPEIQLTTDYIPTLMVSMVKAGKDTITNGASLSHKQNNLSFTFAATSFLNEKQVMYSYRLQGGSTTQWSEPSNNTTISFIDLHPGDYRLEIKASFPASLYPEQMISYAFFIAPPWWQTWLFRIAAAFLIIGFVIFGFWFYYRRKLEKKMTVLEKQQAIEKERTRIATDMHDDLGAGLSRIKFLSETIGIKKQQQQPIEEDISRIREYSHEMIDKMGEIVWALNEKNDTLSDLLSYARAYAVEYLTQNGVRCRVEAPDQFPVTFVSGEFRRNVFLTIKEALHNVVKHAQATEVKFIICINHQLTIRLKDNGIGLDMNNIRKFSNGLTNMESRIREIGGQFEIINEEGTLVNLVVPLP